MVKAFLLLGWYRVPFVLLPCSLCAQVAQIMASVGGAGRPPAAGVCDIPLLLLVGDKEGILSYRNPTPGKHKWLCRRCDHPIGRHKHTQTAPGESCVLGVQGASKEAAPRLSISLRNASQKARVPQGNKVGAPAYNSARFLTFCVIISMLPLRTLSMPDR